MARIIDIIRHAEALSNADLSCRTVLDPPLTTKGEQQAAELGAKLQQLGICSPLVASSPLRRALQTALLGCRGLLDHDGIIVSTPLAQETSSMPCDTGRDVRELEQLFREMPIDFEALTDDWNSKSGPWSQDDVAVRKRAADLRQWLANREEEEVVLVTHGFFIHYLTEDWSDLEKHGNCTSIPNVVDSSMQAYVRL